MLILRKHFLIGQRVKVSAEGGWRQDFAGRILTSPEIIKTRQGKDYVYVVEFDTAQHDLSNDGPYCMAQILSRYIEPE